MLTLGLVFLYLALLLPLLAWAHIAPKILNQGTQTTFTSRFCPNEFILFFHLLNPWLVITLFSGSLVHEQENSWPNILKFLCLVAWCFCVLSSAYIFSKHCMAKVIPLPPCLLLGSSYLKSMGTVRVYHAWALLNHAWTHCLKRYGENTLNELNEMNVGGQTCLSTRQIS